MTSLDTELVLANNVGRHIILFMDFASLYLNDKEFEAIAKSCPGAQFAMAVASFNIIGGCLQVRWAGDRCTVCDSDVDFDFDQLVSCDQCGITVHQTCYGVPELPGEDDLWLCRSCEFKVPSPPPSPLLRRQQLFFQT